MSLKPISVDLARPHKAESQDQGQNLQGQASKSQKFGFKANAKS